MTLFARRGEPAPASPISALLASDGRAGFSEAAIDEVADVAGTEGTVGVLTIARVYGFALGMQHPGLLPTAEELAARRRWVSDAIDRLAGRGITADGQVCITRRHAHVIAAATRRRSARTVVVDQASMGRARRWIEGQLGPAVRRRLAHSGVEVRVVDSRV